MGSCVVFSSAVGAVVRVVFGVSVSGFQFVSAVGGFSWMMISVRQCGHARYGSGLAEDRFVVFNGFVKGLLQDGFGHVQFR